MVVKAAPAGDVYMPAPPTSFNSPLMVLFYSTTRAALNVVPAQSYVRPMSTGRIQSVDMELHLATDRSEKGLVDCNLASTEAIGKIR